MSKTDKRSFEDALYRSKGSQSRQWYVLGLLLVFFAVLFLVFANTQKTLPKNLSARQISFAAASYGSARCFLSLQSYSTQ